MEPGVGWLALCHHFHAQGKFLRKTAVAAGTRTPSYGVPLSVRPNFLGWIRFGAFLISTHSSTAPIWRTARRSTSGRQRRTCWSRSSGRAWRFPAGRWPEVTWRWFGPRDPCERHRLVFKSSSIIFVPFSSLDKIFASQNLSSLISSYKNHISRQQKVVPITFKSKWTCSAWPKGNVCQAVRYLAPASIGRGGGATVPTIANQNRSVKPLWSFWC